MPERYDLHIYQGETFTLTFPEIRDDNDDLIDLTVSGYAAKIELKEHPFDDAAITSWTDGSELTLNSDGTIDLELSSATTSGYSFEEVVYDLRLTHPDGSVTYPFDGHIALDRSITTS